MNEKNKDLEFIKKILEWAINEADLDYLKEFRWKIRDVIEVREVQLKITGGGDKETWVDKMITDIVKEKQREERWRNRNE